MLGNTEHDEPDATSGDDSLPLSENGLDRSKLRDGKRGLARSKRIARAQGSTRTRKILRALVPSVALILVIAVPTMVVEEDWHGRPMIEQGNLLWLVPAAFVVLAFFLGGRLMGKRTELSDLGTGRRRDGRHHRGDDVAVRRLRSPPLDLA